MNEAFALGAGLPHTLVTLVALGMALAFLLADRDSPTSQALASALANMGLGIFLNVNLLHGVTKLPWYSGWLAVPEGLAIIFYLEWLLRVRHTVPSRDLDVRGGDWMLRLGQLAGIAYVALSVLFPERRVHEFLGVSLLGLDGLRHAGFWIFATPVIFASATGITSTILLMRRRPDMSEKLRVLAFIFATPFLIAGFVLPMALAALSVVVGLMAVLIGAVQYHVLQGQRGQFMSRFLSPQVAEIVNSRGLKSAMQQAHVEITVVCCDLRGFTAYAQTHPSQRVIEVLRDYYEVVGKVVAEFGGTIKDYAGDGILILVGAPVAIPDHARRGLEMASRIREVGGPLTARWSTTRGGLGLGVSVATGYVTVGVIGSASRLEYTAVGPAVNLASRLCEQALDRQILVAPRTAELAGNQQLIGHTVTPIKGFDQLLEIRLLPVMG